MCTNYWEFIYESTRTHACLLARTSRINYAPLTRDRCGHLSRFIKTRPVNRIWQKPSRSRFRSCLADEAGASSQKFPRTLDKSLANVRLDIWDHPVRRLIFKVHGHVARDVIKPRSAWAGLTFSRCAPAAADYARDLARSVGDLPATCPRNNRRRSILDNTRRRTLSPWTHAQVCSRTTPGYLTHLTHCRKWKKSVGLRSFPTLFLRS